MTDEQGQRLRSDERDMFDGRVWHGVGCEKCNNTGYLGRIGYFELLKINGPLRAAISSGMSSNDLRDVARNDYVTMRQDGLLRAVEGETTIAEVLRATQDADDMEG